MRLATDYYTLLFARITRRVLLGGVMGSIGFGHHYGSFKMEVRGRVMGFVQMAFSVSQVLGLISLELERIFNGMLLSG